MVAQAGHGERVIPHRRSEDDDTYLAADGGTRVRFRLRRPAPAPLLRVAARRR